jgi:hypothetical protein
MCSNVKKTCTANESMRQNHLQIKAAHHLSNHQEHNNLDFLLCGSWSFTLPVTLLAGVLFFFVRIVLNLEFMSAGPSAGSQLIVNSSQWH